MTYNYNFLKLGQDSIRRLRRFAQIENLMAARIMACVGSSLASASIGEICGLIFLHLLGFTLTRWTG
jgi:hypothetical protein